MYIGVLEDEPHLAQHICEILEKAGHTTGLFNNGADMIKAIGRDTIDLFVLDWRVPRGSGLDVLKHIRNVRGLKTPVLFLTSRTDEQDIIEALNAGADDYCTKPVRPQEFSARITALLRRTYPDRNDQETTRQLLNYTFNKLDNSVHFENDCVNLSEKEFKLALFLFENHERAVSRERLMQEVWGGEGDALSRSLDVHVSWLRKKLNLAATAPNLRLKPIYGFGYRLMAVNGAEDA
jgi:two-component system, OmpR family, response regulator RegX3